MYLTQGLHRALQQVPEKPATVCAGRTISFRELAGRVSRVASVLQGLDVCPGDRVAILAHNSDCYVELLLGVWWAGAVAVPVNTRWSVTEIAYSLADCGTAVLVVDDTFLPLVDAIRTAVVVRRVVHVGAAPCAEGIHCYEALVQSCQPVADVRRGGEELAALL